MNILSELSNFDYINILSEVKKNKGETTSMGIDRYLPSSTSAGYINEGKNIHDLYNLSIREWSIPPLS